MPNQKSQLVVHKFGGSSVANAERFDALLPLLTGKNEIIVVSATQGTTSTLQAIIDAAKVGLPYLPQLAALEKTHNDLANVLLKGEYCKEVLAAIQTDFSEIKEIVHTVELTHFYSSQIQEYVLGYGEIWSAKILAGYLGAYNKVIYLDASQVLFIYEKNGLKCIDWAKSQAALDLFLAGKAYDQIVVTGYIASRLDGQRTNLGRNGSDFSAAIFAKLFNANTLTIWTDVDGIYSADPNRVLAAFVIENLSYKEALELAYFGAKVLHPLTIAPMLESETPIYIKNSFNPSAHGTYISVSPKPSQHIIKGLTCIDDIALINIEGTGMTGVSGIAGRVFQLLHQEKISIILISQASSEHSICFAVLKSDADLAVNVLTENLQFEIERRQIDGVFVDHECAIMAIVGDGMVGSIGTTGKLCESLAKANINIRAISQGSSERNISVVVNRSDINRALQTVHASFYLSRETISIGIIGPGAVGGVLLAQIQAELEHLRSLYQVNLYVRGVMNSKKMLLSKTPIDLNTWEAQLQQSETPADLTEFANHILADDLPHAVIIDCTANPNIAKHYLAFLEKGIHVITPNKHANAGDLEYYQRLKAITQSKNHHYLYEATVCAGLPVINTLQDILKTGDKVSGIEGVVSGTLSYLFSELDGTKTFSEIIYEAKRLGYTESDPREDLSGMDVARKLVCLAREMGHAVSLDDVKLHNLVPEALKTGSVEDFLKNLPAYDHEIQQMVTAAKAKNEKLSYAGTIDANGKITVAIQSLPANHPFATLQSTDNMLIFHTQRYAANPLIIRGPGAGAEVTAAGVFADLLRLVSFLS
jgi:aspartokinase/homoserine dehydrogenase 1